MKITSFFNGSKKRNADNAMGLQKSPSINIKRARVEIIETPSSTSDVINETPPQSQSDLEINNSNPNSSSSSSSSSSSLHISIHPTPVTSSFTPSTRENSVMETSAASKKRSRSCHLSDAVHGQVLQPGICLAIMDTCEFNRLRKIQQLGLCSRVFKDATHNRFSHSVGVSHLAGKFATQLNEQLKREGANESIVASERDIRCVQIAGLCHDLGHAPFSHVFEKVLRNIGVPLGEQHGEWNHEEMGVQMLTYLMTKNNIKWEDYDHNEEEDMQFIRECIVGVPGHERAARDLENAWPRPSWLYDIVSNHESGLDVDKLDYLMRDSSFTHVKVGADFDYLLTSARVRCCDDGQYRIAYPDKAYMEVLKVFQCRYDLHQAVYQHRTVVGLEDLLVDAITAAAEHLHFYDENDQQLSLKEAVWNCHAFSTMTDVLWDNIVNERNPMYRHKLTHAREMFQRIDRREKYPYAGEVYLGAEPALQTRIYGKDDIVLNHAGEKKQYCNESSDEDSDEDDEEERLTEDGVIQELIQKDRSDTLRAKDIIVHFKQAHFGKKSQNPNNAVYFFSKEPEWYGGSPNQKSISQSKKQPAQLLSDEKYSLPRFCDRVIRVYCRDPKHLHLLQNALREWTSENGCPSPRGGSQSQVM